MTAKECYELMDGNYENVLERLNSEKLIKKFLKKFVDDKSFSDITRYIEAGEQENAFRAAHTLKGVCLNLGLDKLYESAVEVTDALRCGKSGTTPEMLERLKSDYELTINAIKGLE